MSAWQESRVVLIALIAALLAGLAGTRFSAAAGSPEGSGTAVTPSQKPDAPPDCKRNPEDPRCKKGPY